mmetsp:Transcript_16729/g.45880  ORF Transcript_16729/g.45880 Transcript_16729/m.45880 type:complete len:361 (-) Transcript_16729:352-1434(-)
MESSHFVGPDLNLFVVEIGIHQGVADRPGRVPPINAPDLALPLLFWLLFLWSVARRHAGRLVLDGQELELEVLPDEIVLKGGKLQDGVPQGRKILGDHVLALSFDVEEGTKGRLEVSERIGAARHEQNVNAGVSFAVVVVVAGGRRHGFVARNTVVHWGFPPRPRKGGEFSLSLDGLLLEVLEGTQHVLESLYLYASLVGVGHRPEQKGQPAEGTAPATESPGGASVKVRGAPDDHVGPRVLHDGPALDRIEELTLDDPQLLQVVRCHALLVELKGRHPIVGRPGRSDAPPSVLGAHLVGQSSVPPGDLRVFPHHVDHRYDLSYLGILPEEPPADHGSKPAVGTHQQHPLAIEQRDGFGG